MEEILKISVPAILVLLCAYYLLDKMHREEKNRREHDLRKGNQAHILPTRLRAYERLVLLLERMMPSNLILNNIKPGMNCIQLQTELLTVIRTEFSHNVSQQIYISDEGWKYVTGTRESLLQLINTCASKFNPDTDATRLAELIIQVYNSTEEGPVEVAIQRLKSEAAQLF